MDENCKHWLTKLKSDTCLRYSFLIFLLSVEVLSITALSIGFTYEGQCSIQSKIPPFLIAGGFIFTIYYTFLIVIMILLIRANPSEIKDISVRKRRALMFSICFMCLFMTIWMIVGCVWIFQVKSTVQSYNYNLSTYCHSTLYDYAFFYCIFLLIICFIHYITFCCMTRIN